MVRWKAYITKKHLINIAAVLLHQEVDAVNAELSVVFVAISIAEVLKTQVPLAAESHCAVNILII